MIRQLLGKPGGGKGRQAIGVLVRELRKTKRHIFTNLAVRLEPWLRDMGDGKLEVMCGLRMYLLQRFKCDFDVDKRLHILTDDMVPRFMMYRADASGAVHSAAVLRSRQSSSGKEIVVEYDVGLLERLRNHVYIIDEGGRFWPSRKFQETSEAVMDYCAQHRHFGDSVWLCAQNTKQLDPSWHRVTQDFYVCTNHGKMRLGVFRQPGVFVLSVYDGPPTGSMMEPMFRKMFKLDIKGLAQCYDTSGGAGHEGGGGADVEDEKSGIHWAYAFVLVLLLAAGTWFGLRWVIGVGNGLLVGASKGVNRAAHGVQTVINIASGRSNAVTAVAGAVLPSVVASNEVRMTGYLYLNGRVVVMLSDGRTYKVGDGHCTLVNSERAVVDGIAYPVARWRPSADNGGMGGALASPMPPYAAVGDSSPETAADFRRRHPVHVEWQ